MKINLKSSYFAIFLFLALTLGLTLKTHGANYYLLTDVGSSARMIGLAGIEGFSLSSNGVFENPASLYQIKNASISLFSTTLMTELYYNNVSICVKTPVGRIGVGYMEAAVFDIPHTGKNETNNRIYEISAYDYKNTIYKLSYQASLLDDLHLGLSYVEYNNSLYDVRGTGSNFDFGTLYNLEPFSFSFIVKNLIPGSYVSYRDGAQEKLNMHILGAVKYSIYDFDLFLQVKRKEGTLLISKALIYAPNFLRFIYFTSGQKEFLVGTQKNNRYTLGLGLNLAGLRFNYAFEKSDHFEYDNNNYFSLSLSL